MEIILVVLFILQTIYFTAWAFNICKKVDTLNSNINKAKRTRREVTTKDFGNPMQDGYRRNKRGQYIPIKPSRDIITSHIGDEEEDGI